MLNKTTQTQTTNSETWHTKDPTNISRQLKNTLKTGTRNTQQLKDNTQSNKYSNVESIYSKQKQNGINIYSNAKK